MAVAMDAMAVAIHIKYALSQNIHLIFYCRVIRSCIVERPHASRRCFWRCCCDKAVSEHSAKTVYTSSEFSLCTHEILMIPGQLAACSLSRLDK